MINYISPSLLNSWLYCTHNENADIQEFIDYLNRIEKPTTEAQQKGLDFEDEVYKGNKPLYNPYVKDGLYQVKVSKLYKDILLLGIIDVLQPDRIYDVKTTKTYKMHPAICASAQNKEKERKGIDNFYGRGYHKIKHFRKMSENKSNHCHKRHGLP